MPPDRSSFKALNTPQESVPQWMGSFDLSAAPNTDLWRKPPCRDTSTAPILYTSLRHRFTSAEVTVSADLEFEWDQAGLVIFAGAPPGREERPGGVETVIVPSIPATERDVSSLVSAISIDSDSPSPLSTSGTPPPRTPDSMNSATLQIDQLVDHVQAPPPYPHAVPASKWIKLSLELSSNAPHATAVVATPDGADWSATTLPGQGRFENGPAFPDSTRPAMSATPAVPLQPLTSLMPVSSPVPTLGLPVRHPEPSRRSHRQRRRTERRRHDDGYETSAPPLSGLTPDLSLPPPYLPHLPLGAISPTNFAPGPISSPPYAPPYIHIPRPTHPAALRLKMERLGDALWLWYQPLPAPSTPYCDSDPSNAPSAGPRPGEWVKLREVTWFFFGVEDKVIRVGVYASRPASVAERMGGSGLFEEEREERDGGGMLKVRFDGLEIF